MGRRTATAGQFLVNDALPEDLRDYSRVLDKGGVKSLLREVAQQHPDKYREVSHTLSQIGRETAQTTGGMSFGLRHLRKSKAGSEMRDRIQAAIQKVVDNDDLDDDGREAQILKALDGLGAEQQKAVYEEAAKANNPLALQVASGSRGNKMNLASLLASDLLYADNSDRPIPLPVMRSYSEGLSPAEYFAGTYGARKGTADVKMATARAGFLSKQMNQVAHRLVVSERDYDGDGEPDAPPRGLPVETSDQDSEGSLLAKDVGPYKRNTVITPKIRKHLARLGHDHLLVRSPAVGGTADGGVYAMDVGVRENGLVPGRGETVGLQAAQALSEPISQGQLSSKHSGGVAGEGAAVSGFDYINQLFQVPKSFTGGAAHASLDGLVQSVKEAPAGGQYIVVDGEQHYVPAGQKVRVKKGDEVEAGDLLSDGIPNPSKITQHKGVGEGRRYFISEMRKAMDSAGLGGHRRNIEILSRGLINHVRMTEEHGDGVPGDVMPYSTLEHTWQPREGHQQGNPKQMIGKYLERPVLHYTIGTKVKPSMVEQFKRYGVENIVAHDDPPPFETEMIRGMDSLLNDPDWMVRQYGSNLQKGFLESVHRGRASEERGTSFVPSLAKKVDFGHAGGPIKSPEPGFAPPDPNEEIKKPAPTIPSPSIMPAAPKKTGLFGSGLFSKKAEQPQDYWHGSPHDSIETLREGSYVSPDRETAALMGRFFEETGQTWDDNDLAAPHTFGQEPVFKPGREPQGLPTLYRVPATSPQLDLLGNPYEHVTKEPLAVEKESFDGLAQAGNAVSGKAMNTLTGGKLGGGRSGGMGRINYRPPIQAGAGLSRPAAPDLGGIKAPGPLPAAPKAPLSATPQGIAQKAQQVVRDNPITVTAPAAVAGGGAYLNHARNARNRPPVPAAPKAPPKPAGPIKGLMGKVPGAARAGRALRMGGRALGPLGFAIDGGITANEIYQGRSEQFADETGQNIRDTLNGRGPEITGNRVADTALNAVDTVFSPSSNANLIGQGVMQTGGTVMDTADALQGGHDTAYDATMQARKPGSTLAHPINDIQEPERGSTAGEYFERLVEDPYDAVGMAADNGVQLGEISGVATAERDFGTQLERQRMAGRARTMEPLRSEYERWMAAGQPETSNAHRMREFAEYDRQKGLTDYQRMNEDESYGQTLTNDMLTEDVGIPGYENVVVPGTSVGVRGFANPMDILKGNFTFNPFFTR